MTNAPVGPTREPQSTATGVTAPPAGAELDELRDIAGAAFEWWRMKRPLSWNPRKHHGNPIVNCNSYAERELAKKVAVRAIRLLKGMS